MYCIDSFCPDCLSSLKIVNIVVLHHAINAQQAIRPLNTDNLLRSDIKRPSLKLGRLECFQRQLRNARKLSEDRRTVVFQRFWENVYQS